MNLNPTTVCKRLVRASADDSVNHAGKWATSRYCRGKVAVRVLGRDGSTISCYCKKHAPRNNDSLAVVAVDATPEQVIAELKRAAEFDAAFMARIRKEA